MRKYSRIQAMNSGLKCKKGIPVGNICKPGLAHT